MVDLEKGRVDLAGSAFEDARDAETPGLSTIRAGDALVDDRDLIARFSADPPGHGTSNHHCGSVGQEAL